MRLANFYIIITNSTMEWIISLLFDFDLLDVCILKLLVNIKYLDFQEKIIKLTNSYINANCKKKSYCLVNWKK